MAYGQDFLSSARRHLTAADQLYSDDKHAMGPGNRAVAGYLFGIAGELALKQLMKVSGMKQLCTSQHRGDPFYAHFPQLKSQLRDTLCGRRSGELLVHAKNNRLFEHWSTDMRYAPTTDVKSEWTEAWKAQAKSLVDAMSL